MNFKESKYYNKEFLGLNLYEYINYNDKILTVQEFFRINDIQKEYHIKKLFKDYKLKVFDNYYELDCQKYQSYCHLIFDKPVHITGEYCANIIAPEIVVNSNQNSVLSCCVANKITINNNYKGNCQINNLKANHVYFYNSMVHFEKSEINNFFILNKKLKFYNDSILLNYHKIKFFGACNDLKEKILKFEHFKQGIIHIE